MSLATAIEVENQGLTRRAARRVAERAAGHPTVNKVVSVFANRRPVQQGQHLNVFNREPLKVGPSQSHARQPALMTWAAVPGLKQEDAELPLLETAERLGRPPLARLQLAQDSMGRPADELLVDRVDEVADKPRRHLREPP
jgi:hypothetical protein